MAKKTVLYARVSTEGKGQEQSIDAQLEQLRSYAAEHGLDAIEFSEQVSARDLKNRSEWQKIQDLVSKGSVDRVVLTRLDRGWRSTSHFYYDASVFQEQSVDLVLLKQGFDTSTPFGRFALGFGILVAEMESDLARDRTREGMAHARKHGTKSGKSIGRPRTRRQYKKLIDSLRDFRHLGRGQISAAADDVGIPEGTARQWRDEMLVHDKWRYQVIQVLPAKDIEKRCEALGVQMTKQELTLAHSAESRSESVSHHIVQT